MIIDYDSISIRRGEHTVLEGVNLQVEKGEMVYLMGAVGSGKTSLLKSFYGEVPCEGERACVLDFDMLRLSTSKHPALRRRLGIVFQDFRLMPDRTVHKNLEFVLQATDWNQADEREERISQVLKMVRIENAMHKRPYELSGGEQQRISIARALLNRPELILADEPTGNLDNENGELILAILDEIRRSEGATVVVATHNPLWPQYFPGTVYQCGNGKIVRSETQAAATL
ncbi:MAG: ATP-binding cassette domain-containing protein [Bacteroidaceae bacterium]|nr:ATP-binding cassette domain-containing protein [Bacteroidaceae bacterium]